MLQSKQVETAYLALGSNLGDRLGYLRKALVCFTSDVRIQSVMYSRVYETKAIGIPNAPDFLNAVILVKTDYSAEKLLELVLSIEQQLGRVRSENVTSRTLDIDILLYGKVKSNLKDLTIPHPRMTKRAFVLLPLNDLDSDLEIEGRMITDWIKNCDTSLVKCTNFSLK